MLTQCTAGIFTVVQNILILLIYSIKMMFKSNKIYPRSFLGWQYPVTPKLRPPVQLPTANSARFKAHYAHFLMKDDVWAHRNLAQVVPRVALPLDTEFHANPPSSIGAYSRTELCFIYVDRQMPFSLSHSLALSQWTVFISALTSSSFLPQIYLLASF